MLAALWPVANQAHAGGSGARVAVQPFDGEVGPALRDDVVRTLRSRGYRIITSIPRADGTGPYLSLAQDHQLTAFVTGDVETHRSRQSITFLVWSGATASVVGRWSATAPPKRLRRTVARGFWKHLSKALAAAQAPPRPELEQAAPMYIDASYGNDAPISRR
jgi:hypothetical protein